MNNWQLSYSTPVDLIEHLKKPYFRYDNKEKEATKIIFDERANLIWCGDSYGRISSYDPNFQLYTRYTGHFGAMPVNDMLSHRDGILSLSDDSLHFSNRRGVTTMNITSIDISLLSGLKTMCYASKDVQNVLYCAGNNSNSGILSIDLNKNCLSSIIDYSSKVKLMCSNNKIISIGKQSGSIDLLDPNSNHIIKSFSAHSATISCMDSRDYTLVTVGKSRRFNSMFADPFINVYDLRTMQQLPPVSFSKGTNMGSGGADYVKLHPVLPTVMTVASEQGSFDFIDLSNPTLRTQFVHPCRSVKDMVISANGDYLGFLTGDNTLGTWCRSSSNPGFTNTPDILEYPDFINDGILNVPGSIDNDDYSLSSVGMPYYPEKLLSAWSQVVFRSKGTLPKAIDVSQLTNSKLQPIKPQQTNIIPSNNNNGINNNNNNNSNINNNGNNNNNKLPHFYKYNCSKYGHRNVIESYVCYKDIRKTVTNKLNIVNKNSSANGTLNVIDTELLRCKPLNDQEIPPAYIKLQLTHGRYGSDNFDFKSFNKTTFSGLDTDIDHPYTNSILQLYRFIPEIFNFIVGCLKDENFTQNSLLTETGYLFDMMQRSQGRVCFTSNFQTTLDSLDDSSMTNSSTPNMMHLQQNNTIFQSLECLSLDSEDMGSLNCADSLAKGQTQKFNDRFLNSLIADELQRSTHTITIEEDFGFHLESEVLSSCSHYEKKTRIIPTLSVTSPVRNSTKHINRKLTNHTILPYIESSMKRIKQVQSTCEICNKNEIVEHEIVIKNLPPVMSLELLLSENEWTVAKSVNDWLSPEFYATMSKDKAVLKNHPNELKTSNPIFKYELNGYVAKVTDTTGENRYVTYSKIYDNDDKRYKWYLFNDYLVTEIEEEEALNITYWWKTVETVIYCDSEELRKPFLSVDTYPINYNILYRDHFANGVRKDAAAQYQLLTKGELSDIPKPGTLIAIDAEFVILNEEMSDIDCKGIKTIIRPKKTALARVSVLRGEEGDLYGVPFIDDYIVQTDHIQDYVTKYSGINPGDLDPKNSSKALVTRTVAYRKIWLLMQLGCVFVGHGLSNDFKQININVPQEQIRDTAIYFLQGKRFLSLRYLAYAILDRNIQEGNHDSIEDAYTALILYKKYLDLKEKGTLNHVLDVIYEEGRTTNYKVPETNKEVVVTKY
ncbi:hypothetical protein Kpol_1033p30 [Vanderwaltozyma polyspora DSM 70294]|uniref:USP domain-containing protein n=1 Tax=Vanderwaltozyma polyspora (strain ATCC 22028 / DSM 70294 / BCRC 21397 / CBS 2163 / NBRC 10782 / NRRL Y-8283 / UCD 57-17) TaxID=436907 RepID=A7TJ26_VANPO|nr:uncharacterized protein Kpol_1033p30 [Vanderwaltozyma polyspora DSM 70294]EDO17725.1 hypothetical protein Kpol_1033p30 [Vanderwaltozyma polyspora DSM 70294]